MSLTRQIVWFSSVSTSFVVLVPCVSRLATDLHLGGGEGGPEAQGRCHKFEGGGSMHWKVGGHLKKVGVHDSQLLWWRRPC